MSSPQRKHISPQTAILSNSSSHMFLLFSYLIRPMKKVIQEFGTKNGIPAVINLTTWFAGFGLVYMKNFRSLELWAREPQECSKQRLVG